MCCFFKSRKTPACIVFVLSFLGVVAGIAMIYFAIKLNGSEFMDKISEVEDLNAEIDFENTRKLIFYGLVIFALVAIIAACMGMVACKIKNRCYTICYGTILLPTWIIIILVGSVAVYASTEGKDKIMEECYKVIQKLNEAQGGSVTSAASGDCNKTYDSNIKVNLEVYEAMYINDEMCSVNCPCKSNLDAKTKSDWESLNKKDVNRCKEWNF